MCSKLALTIKHPGKIQNGDEMKQYSPLVTQHIIWIHVHVPNNLLLLFSFHFKKGTVHFGEKTCVVPQHSVSQMKIRT